MRSPKRMPVGDTLLPGDRIIITIIAIVSIVAITTIYIVLILLIIATTVIVIIICNDTRMPAGYTLLPGDSEQYTRVCVCVCVCAYVYMYTHICVIMCIIHINNM